MKNLTIDLPVCYAGRKVENIQLHVGTTCIDGMLIVKLNNGTSNDLLVTAVGVDTDRVLSANSDKYACGLAVGTFQVFQVKVNMFTKLEMVVQHRDGDINVLAKVWVRGGLWLNALYRSDSKGKVVVNRFDEGKKEVSQWRKPNSRLQSALTA